MSTAPLTPYQIAHYHESKQAALNGSLITCLVIVNLSIICRTLDQYTSFRRLYLDDAFVITSGILLNVVVGNLLASTHHGLGLHAWRVSAEDSKSPHNLSVAFEHVWLSMIFHVPCLSTIRICLLYFNRRLFVVRQGWLRIVWWANLTYEVLWLVGATGFYLFQCWPPPWYWLQFYPRYDQSPPGTIKHGQCEAQTVVNVSIPLFFSLVSDVSILLMPILAVSQLQMTWKRKTAMSALFPIGLLFCVFEVARIVQLWVSTDDKNDPSWGVCNFIILSAAAETTAILRACLPVMMPSILRKAMKLQDFWSLKLRGHRRKGQATAVERSVKGYRRFGASDHDEQDDEERQVVGDQASHSISGVLENSPDWQSTEGVQRSEDIIMLRTDIGEGSRDHDRSKGTHNDSKMRLQTV